MNHKIGVDGGGTKTACILVDEAGAIVARHEGPGCNPSLEGPKQARMVLEDALAALLAQTPQASVDGTLLCMAGAPEFWRETAGALAAFQGSPFGRVEAVPDSLPVLEAATRGGPGLVLHAGTGSFVAARTAKGDASRLLDGAHYAGGLGWKFGDPGSGYDIGRRAIARGLLELQGWAEASSLGTLLRIHTRRVEADDITRHFYRPEASATEITGLAPAVLKAAVAGDLPAREVVLASATGLLDLAIAVAGRLFPSSGSGAQPTVRAGLSGRILAYPFVVEALAKQAPFPLFVVPDAPDEGLRLLVKRWSV